MGQTGEGGDLPGAADRDPAASRGLDFEQARDELVEVVKALEVGGLSLDESVRLWERGEHLARICEERLAGARERVESTLDAAAADERAGAPDTTQPHRMPRS